MPYSQKFIQHYENIKVRGAIIYLDSYDDDIIMWYTSQQDDKLTIYFISITIEGCSFFGNTRGYFSMISKLNK
jgi:hypothetical protein